MMRLPVFMLLGLAVAIAPRAALAQSEQRYKCQMLCTSGPMMRGNGANPCRGTGQENDRACIAFGDCLDKCASQYPNTSLEFWKAKCYAPLAHTGLCW
jgi:hypothetical protein